MFWSMIKICAEIAVVISSKGIPVAHTRWSPLTRRVAELCRVRWREKSKLLWGRINGSFLQLTSELSSWETGFPWRIMLVAGRSFQAWVQVRGLMRYLDLLLLFLTQCRWVTGGTWCPWYLCPSWHSLSWETNCMAQDGYQQTFWFRVNHPKI